DAILIKENHIAAAGSVEAAVRLARETNPGMPVEIEVENEAEVVAALDARADRLLLDNFTTANLRQAVALVAGRASLEASGGVTLDNIRDIAATGVDFISVGDLTKDLQATDYSMVFSLT
ncbi:MAG: nicotinate-nucleotide diphosphorylase (carboxylating), partial [Thiohalobacterales bacterium]|nr:nicotinate-nucleotide diphosphorylase (carboxylating) [Thiohalobacterales bacterium]